MSNKYQRALVEHLGEIFKSFKSLLQFIVKFRVVYYFHRPVLKHILYFGGVLFLMIPDTWHKIFE